MSVTPKLQERKSETFIPYYPELGKLVTNLGFETSSQVISYFRKSNVVHLIDRTFTSDSSEDRIMEFIREQEKLVKDYNQNDEGFIFVMGVPNSDNIELLHIHFMSKDQFIKYLKLKIFS